MKKFITFIGSCVLCGIMIVCPLMMFSSVNKISKPVKVEATAYTRGTNGYTSSKTETVQKKNFVQLDSGNDSCKHDYSEWEELKYPTATQEGLEMSICKKCLHTETRTIPKIKPVSENAIVIPSAGINESIWFGTLTQHNIDANDIMCDVYTYSFGPCLAGHCTRKLGSLYKTKNDSYIYLYVHGKEVVYKVVDSEEGEIRDDDIYGLQTEKPFFSCTEKNCLLKIFTCHDGNKTRWIVTAKLLKA